MKRIISVIACVLLLSGCGAGHQNDADSGNAEPLEGEQITEGTPDNTTADPDTSLESADTIQETAASNSDGVTDPGVPGSCKTGSTGAAVSGNGSTGNPAVLSAAPETESFIVGTEPAFILSSASVKAGSTAEVTISLHDNPGIAGVLLYLTYDPALILEEVAFNESMIGESVEPAKGMNPAPLVWISPYEDLYGDGEFVSLKFSVPQGTAAGDYRICISYEEGDVFNLAEESVAFTTENGVITVL